MTAPKKAPRRGTPKRKKPAPKKMSTALVRAARALKAAPKVFALPPEPVVRHGRTLTDGIELGELGLVELKMTAAEELVLGEEVNPAVVSVLPQGQCLDPATVVLHADLEWRPISATKIGDRLLSVDENLPGLGLRRKMRRADVTAIIERVAPRFLVTFESGREVIC